MVTHGNLADAEAPLMRQHRNEAVQLAVEREVFDQLAPIRLEAAVDVVQLDPVVTLTIPLKTFDGSVLVRGSSRGYFQPETRS